MSDSMNGFSQRGDKVWTTLCTNMDYIEGVLNLEYSLRRVHSKYPLVVLYTDSFEEAGRKVLQDHKIDMLRIEYLLPAKHKDYSSDPRFYHCWSKLQPFSLTQFKRIVQLDSDMVVTQNMDELMDIPLDQDKLVFAASHACVCNPFHKSSYPEDWIPENCAYTHYHEYKYEHDWEGPPCNAGLAMCNGGLQVVEPNEDNFHRILDALSSSATSEYEFSDQSLLSDVFEGKWLPLSYKYNALKTLKISHKSVWKDEEVKNVHYILTPKPWEMDSEFVDETGTFEIWRRINEERLASMQAANGNQRKTNGNAQINLQTNGIAQRKVNGNTQLSFQSNGNVAPNNQTNCNA